LKDAGAVASAVETFKEAVATPEQDLVAAISALEEALSAATTPLDEGAGTEGAKPAEDSEVLDLAADDPIAALLTTLKEMVEAGQAAQVSESLLPPVAEAAGNGRAYEKFLAMYRAMVETAAVDEHAIDASA